MNTNNIWTIVIHSSAAIIKVWLDLVSLILSQEQGLYYYYGNKVNYRIKSRPSLVKYNMKYNMKLGAIIDSTIIAELVACG